MKTSNKILWGLLIFILLVITTLLVYIRIQWHAGKVELAGISITETRDVKPFTNLDISGGFEVYYTSDSLTSFKLEGDSALVAMVETRQINEDLEVTLKNVFSKKRRVKVYIHNKALSELDISAGSRFKTENILTGRDLEVDGSAGAEITMKVQYESIEAGGSAGSIMTLEGDCKELDIRGSAGSIVNAGELIAKTCDIHLTAGSIAKIHVEKELEVDASAGSMIKYAGNPKLKQIDLSAGARINSVD
jgi:hypothetical protein